MRRVRAGVLLLTGLLATAAAQGCNGLLGNQDAIAVADGGTGDARFDSGPPDASADTVNGGMDAGMDRGAPSDGGVGDGTFDAACTADANSDPANCGRCGHDCLGGACEGGVCQATELRDAGNGAYAMASDGTKLYFSGSGGIEYVDLDAGTSGILAPNVGYFDRLAVDATEVYWLGNSGLGLYSCPKPPSTCVPALLVQVYPPGGLALDQANLYWSVDSADGGVFACAKGMCASTSRELAAAASSSNVATGGGFVVWSAIGGLFDFADGGAGTLYGSSSAPGVVGASSTQAYWSDSTGSTLATCSLTACSPSQIPLSDAGPVGGLAADDTGVYYAVGGEIWTYSTSGMATRLASGQGRAVGYIAVDPLAVYWATSSGGATLIMRVAKP